MNTAATTAESIYADLGLTKSERKEKEKSSNELAQEDFMKLMVTQLTHQDPFKPMENGDFLAQIAQFSSVSGLDKLNESFDTLSTALTSSQAMQAGALINREVLAVSDKGLLPHGGMLHGVLDLQSSAGDVVVKIEDAHGALVKEITLGTKSAGQVDFTWDGSTENGEYAPPGVYNITAEGVIDDENTAIPALVTARVASVSLGGAQEGLTLHLDGLGPVAFNEIVQIY